MATTITLGRPGSGTVRRFFRNLRLHPTTLGDAWSDEATAAAASAQAVRDPAGEAIAGFAKSALGWGVLAFAAWTVGIRVADTWRKS